MVSVVKYNVVVPPNPIPAHAVNPLENAFFQKPDGLCQFYANNTGVHLAHREETFSRRQKLFY